MVSVGGSRNRRPRRGGSSRGAPQGRWGEGRSERGARPFWFVKDANGVVRAIVAIWYDNFLVATARASGLNGIMRTALDKAMRAFKLVWKKDDKGRAWCKKDNEAEYIGIHFERTQDGVFTWRHIDENIESWKSAAIEREMPLTDVAQVLGFISWDAHVRLGRRLSRPIRSLMSRVGSTYHIINAIGETKRVRDATVFHLEEDEFEAARSIYEELLRNRPLFFVHLTCEFVGM